MLVVMPVFVVVLLRLNRQYEREAVQLEHDVPAAATAPILRRHVVLVFVDRLDMASARAIQYARSLTPDELRAVHFVHRRGRRPRELAEEWARTGLQRVPLELVDCPDRRLTRAAVECVVRELADGETEVSVLLPDRKYKGIWHRVLHDKTADAILEQVSRLPHANVTSVPFHLDSLDAGAGAAVGHRRPPARPDGRGPAATPPLPTTADGDADATSTPSSRAACPITDATLAQAGAAWPARSDRCASPPSTTRRPLELILVDGTGVDLGHLPRPPRASPASASAPAWPSRAPSASTRPASRSSTPATSSCGERRRSLGPGGRPRPG